MASIPSPRAAAGRASRSVGVRSCRPAGLQHPHPVRGHSTAAGSSALGLDAICTAYAFLKPNA